MPTFCRVAFRRFTAQWIAGRYGNPAKFPPQSMANAVIRRFTTKRPPAATPTADSRQTATLLVAIPDSKAKPAAQYRYLGHRAQAALAEVIDDEINQCLWTELEQAGRLGCSVAKAIDAWCEAHSIDIDLADTARKRFYRMQRTYARHGRQPHAELRS